MAKLIFRLNNVPEPEADGVRALLDNHNIEFYETHEGRWGLSVAAIWLKNNDDFSKARELIDDFQQQHRAKMRENYINDKAAGRIPTMWDILKTRPLMFALYWALIIFILFLSTVPVYRFFND